MDSKALLFDIYGPFYRSKHLLRSYSCPHHHRVPSWHLPSSIGALKDRVPRNTSAWSDRSKRTVICHKSQLGSTLSAADYLFRIKRALNTSSKEYTCCGITSSDFAFTYKYAQAANLYFRTTQGWPLGLRWVAYDIINIAYRGNHPEHANDLDEHDTIDWVVVFAALKAAWPQLKSLPKKTRHSARPSKKKGTNWRHSSQGPRHVPHFPDSLEGLHHVPFHYIQTAFM